MNAKNILVGAALAIAAAGFGVAWSHHRSARENERLLATLASQRATAAGEIQRQTARLAMAEQDRAGLQAALEEARKMKLAAVTAPPPKSPPAGAAPPEPMELIMKDPKLQNYFLASQRAGLTTSYGPFFRKSGLEPAQIAKFHDIMIKRAEQNMDLQAVAQAQGLPPDSPVLATLRKQAEDETAAAQAELLGPAGYEQFLQYERTVGVRDVVQRFVGAAALEALSLTAPQAEQLTQVLADASPRYANGGKANYQDIDWTAADRQLAGVLSEAQLKLFQQIEPMGGGPSRFGARLSTMFDQAVKADNAAASAAGKPPGGG